MTFVPNFPPSILRKVEEESDGKKKTKEDFKKMKEIEEARKLAVMPAMKDEEGRDINPHIPQYIMQAPWYYGALQPTLRHQRMQDEQKRVEASGTMKGSSVLDKWYKKGLPTDAPRVKKYRDGACENCGSITHKRRDCLERPRKVGAKYTGLDIAPDEYLQEELQLSYDAKRDRWNGYDPREHQRLILESQRLEEARKLVKAKKLEEKLAAAGTQSKGQEEPAASAAAPVLEDDGDLEDDDDRYGDELDMPGQKFDSKQRQSIRNLRIREDTAKYLFNLDPNSAYYDPKTRAMRENPFENSGKPESEVPFAGDNFIRDNDEALAMLNRQVFAWEMHNKLGLDLHLQADPTRLEMLAMQVSSAKNQVQSHIREEILDRYGGREHFEAPPRDLLLGQWETYAEYTPTGRVLKGLEKPSVTSRYEEDVYINNHTSVWGSYWYAGQWGYKCCQSLIKESYCTGAKGKSASTSSSVPPAALPEVPAGASGTSLLAPVRLPHPDSSGSDEEEQQQQQKSASKSKKEKKRKKNKSRHNSESVTDKASPEKEAHATRNVQSEEPEGEDGKGEEVGSRKSESDDVANQEQDEEEARREMERHQKEREADLQRSDARREVLRARRAKKRRKNKEKKKSQKRTKGKRSKRRRSSSSSSSSNSNSSSSESESETEGSEKARERRILEAVEREKKRQAEVDRLMKMNERDRPYNSLGEVKAPTEEEMEAYYRTRRNPNDPMADFM
uniref:Pre-mRNA-splicing factor SLU7 n=1 Tax=Schistocephalus solidus TaxID=70667 RepID=A0A0X3NZR8_SCHSO